MSPKSSQKPSPWQKKLPLTHFLCLPLVTEASKPQLDRSLKQFGDDVCSGSSGESAAAEPSEPSFRVHPKAIRPLGTLHLTLGVMSLNKDQLAKASELLKSLNVTELLRNSDNKPTSMSDSDATPDAMVPPLSITLKGLESMHTPESTSILYAAPLDPTKRLYDCCLALQKHFQDFLIPDKRPLKLHATIVNTIYAKTKKSAAGSGNPAPVDRSQGHGPNAKSSLNMDARAILQKYEDYIWAEDFSLDRVAICEMGAKKVFDAAKVRIIEEKYVEVFSVALPA